MANCATVQSLHFLCNAEQDVERSFYALHCTPNGVTVLLHSNDRLYLRPREIGRSA